MSSNQYKEYLLDIRALIEEAVQRLGDTNVVYTWLLTPISPDGKNPLDYLREGDYSTFHGFLLHTCTGSEVFQHVAPSSRVHKERSQEEIEDALERLRPRIWWNEDNDTNMSDGSGDKRT